MNSEQTNTTENADPPDDAWDVFLPDGEDEPLPDEGDFWLEMTDEEDWT